MQFCITPVYQHNASPRALKLMQTSNRKQIFSAVFSSHYKGWSLRVTGTFPTSEKASCQTRTRTHKCATMPSAISHSLAEQMSSQGKANHSPLSRVPRDPSLSLPGFISKMSKAHQQDSQATSSCINDAPLRGLKENLGRPRRDRCCWVDYRGLHSAGISWARYNIAGEFGPLMSNGITCSTSAKNKQSQPDNRQCQQFPSQDKNTQIKPTVTSHLPGGWCPTAQLLPDNVGNTLRL